MKENLCCTEERPYVPEMPIHINAYGLNHPILVLRSICVFFFRKMETKCEFYWVIRNKNRMMSMAMTSSSFFFHSLSMIFWFYLVGNGNINLHYSYCVRLSVYDANFQKVNNNERAHEVDLFRLYANWPLNNNTAIVVAIHSVFVINLLLS